MGERRGSPIVAALAVLIAALVVSVVGPGAAPAGAAPAYDFSAAEAEAITATTGCSVACGTAVSVLRTGTAPGAVDLLWRQGFGTVSPSQTVWTASAGKMVTGITVMTVVDDGLLSLDTTVGSMFPAYAGTGKGAITLRQLLSHTSGIVQSADCLTDPNTTLAACADQALALPLSYPPGTVFWYAGPPMQIAARMVELATGKAFVDVFRDNVVTPLGLPTIKWGSQTNPRVDGGHVPVGLQASALDYERILEMMLGRGQFRGTTFLSAAAFAQLIDDVTEGTTPMAKPDGGAAGYGIGMWVDTKAPDGTTTAVSSGGAFGALPWVDFGRGEAGWYGPAGDQNKVKRAGAVKADVDAQIDAVPAGTPAPVPPPPTVTALSVNRGPVAGGQQVQVTGTGLRKVTAAWFGSTTPAAAITYLDDTRLVLTSPARAAGLVNVLLDTPGGRSATGTHTWYTYVAAPTVTAVTPNKGATAGGQSVTITGTNLGGATQVWFSTSSPATSFTVVSPTQIVAVTPARAAGLVNVLVDTPGGRSATSAATRFTFSTATPPVVSAISPTRGPIAGGTAVTITGSGFATATRVRFATTDATSFTVVDDTTITAVSPARPVGYVNVFVDGPGGASASSSATVFAYTAT